MRVLLAGATGAIGRPLVPALVAAGHEVLAVIRNPANRELVSGLGGEPVVADVMRRDELVRAVDGRAADAVMHQATALRRASPRPGPDDPTNALRREGTANLLAAAQAVGARRFVTQSLITGYGYRDHGDRELTEGDRFGEPSGGPTDPVVAGLAATERQVFEAAGIEGIALRYGLFYGPHAFSDLLAGLLRKRVPCVPAGGGGQLCWVHVADAAQAAVAALDRGTPGQAYQIVDGQPLTWREFAAAVAEAHRTPRPLPMPRWLLRLISPYLACLLVDTSMRASAARAARELGWTPAHRSVPDGLAADLAGRG